jgi:hypothetical protein
MVFVSDPEHLAIGWLKALPLVAVEEGKLDPEVVQSRAWLMVKEPS